MLHHPSLIPLVSMVKEEVDKDIKGKHAQHNKREHRVEYEHGGKGKKQRFREDATDEVS